MGKYNTPKNGTTCVSNEVIQWAENGNQDIRVVAENADRYFTVGEDSMAHKMKGNIGLFISSGEHIRIYNTLIDGVEVKGNLVGSDRKLFNVGDKKEMKGAISYGIVVTGSNDVEIKNVNIKNVESTYESVGLLIKSSTNIGNEGLTITNIDSNGMQGKLIFQE